MKVFGIIDEWSNKLIAFATADMTIKDCYMVSDIEHDITLIGKRYNNGSWEDVTEPLTEQDKNRSEYALILGRI